MKSNACFLVSLTPQGHVLPYYTHPRRSVLGEENGDNAPSCSIGRNEANIQVILKATPSVDPASSNTFMEMYEKLFDKRYPYVDKVARMYLLDPSGLQNVMPDETGPTPSGGPRDTLTASYS
ncbi:hypothetical protein Tco_0991539 [Tanacetum coccineum]|uniref:Uncharacterized protein n=1 Tax=Tanacetum coccineum TaxID=301880 RepID=A0ABQ5EZV4_9ASTR